MYLYYEVYEPETAAGDALAQDEPGLLPRAVKVFEKLPLVERRTRRGRSSRRHLPVRGPRSRVPPGLYTCQVNIIDDMAGRFVFPRLALYVR